MTESAYLTHRTPGRARLRFPQRRGDARFFAATAARLGACEGLRRIESNPRTGSLLLLHEGDLSPILEFGAREQLFALVHGEPREPPLAPRLRDDVQALGDTLRRSSGGQLDLRTAALLFLVTGALVQLVRGQVLGPASTLLWYASSLLAAGAATTPEPDRADDGP